MKSVATDIPSMGSGDSWSSHCEQHTAAKPIKSCLKVSGLHRGNKKSVSLRSVRFSEVNEVRYIPRVKTSRLRLPTWTPSVGSWVYSGNVSFRQQLYPVWSSPLAHRHVSPGLQSELGHSIAPKFAFYGEQHGADEQVETTSNSEEAPAKVSST